MIVSPNTAIDSYYILPRFEIGQPNRASHAWHTAGSKGINMARAFLTLGGRALCLGFVGGHAGRFVVDELAREGIAHDMLSVETDTRRCCTFLAQGLPDVTVVLEPGQPLGEAAPKLMCERVIRHAADASHLVLAGSLPPDFPARYYATLIHETRGSPAKVCLDCPGEVLRLGAEAGPELIKVNRKEFCDAFGLDPASPDWDPVRRVFDRLQNAGTEVLIVTDGQRGAFVFSREVTPFHVLTQVGSWVSTAGVGDTFMAGLVLSLSRGEGLESAVRYASAAASANLQYLGCGILKPADVEQFLGQTSAEPLGLKND